MKKYLLLAIFSVLLFSCKTSSVFQVSEVGNEPGDYKERSVYALPQTVFLINVEFEKEIFIPGPYRLFTEKFLGLENSIMESGYDYRLLNVDIQSYQEPDPDHYYSVNLISGEFNWEKYFKLSGVGLILDPSSIFSREYSSEKYHDDGKTPYFTDLSVKRNLTEITDTLYKTIISDSSYVRVPVLRSHREAKTLEQKAEEAANFIIKIRKRRFKLLAGQYELFPEGDALAISVEELDKLEKEYLELFLGKRIKEKYRKKFLVIPDENENIQNHPFARFSPQLGLLNPDENAGKELVLVLDPQKKFKNRTGFNSEQNSLLYRLPNIADVKVRLVNEILYEGRLPVFQMGDIIGYPFNTE